MLREVAAEDWTRGNWSCNEAEQVLLLLALGGHTATNGDYQTRIARDL